MKVVTSKLKSIKKNAKANQYKSLSMQIDRWIMTSRSSFVAVTFFFNPFITVCNYIKPASKRSSFQVASEFLEKPSYELHDIYRALDVLGNECDFIQSEVYKNSNFLSARNDKILYYDCSNYYFEIEQEDGNKKYGKSKEHRPNPIIQMGLFMDGDGIPLAFSTFPRNAMNKPL